MNAVMSKTGFFACVILCALALSVPALATDADLAAEARYQAFQRRNIESTFEGWPDEIKDAFVNFYTRFPILGYNNTIYEVRTNQVRTNFFANIFELTSWPMMTNAIYMWRPYWEAQTRFAYLIRRSKVFTRVFLTQMQVWSAAETAVNTPHEFRLTNYYNLFDPDDANALGRQSWREIAVRAIVDVVNFRVPINLELIFDRVATGNGGLERPLGHEARLSAYARTAQIPVLYWLLAGMGAGEPVQTALADAMDAELSRVWRYFKNNYRHGEVIEDTGLQGAYVADAAMRDKVANATNAIAYRLSAHVRYLPYLLHTVLHVYGQSLDRISQVNNSTPPVLDLMVHADVEGLFAPIGERSPYFGHVYAQFNDFTIDLTGPAHRAGLAPLDVERTPDHVAFTTAVPCPTSLVTGARLTSKGCVSRIEVPKAFFEGRESFVLPARSVAPPKIHVTVTRARGGGGADGFDIAYRLYGEDENPAVAPTLPINLMALTGADIDTAALANEKVNITIFVQGMARHSERVTIPDDALEHFVVGVRHLVNALDNDAARLGTRADAQGSDEILTLHQRAMLAREGVVEDDADSAEVMAFSLNEAMCGDVATPQSAYSLPGDIARSGGR